MHITVKVVVSLCWIAVFGTLAVVTLVAAVDGLAVARETMPWARPLLDIGPLATQPLMGGLSLGSALVMALFAWMMLTALIVEHSGSRGADNPVELAHGGAFGIGGVIFLTALLDAPVLVTAVAGLLVAALVLSLLLSRLTPAPGQQTLAPREARDRAIAAAHLYSVDMRRRSAEIVPFPLRGEFARWRE